MEATYSYSPDGYMVKEVSDFGVFTTNLTYNGENLIHRKTEYSSAPSHDINESTYDYNANEGNFAFSSLVVDLYGEAFMDELHKHVLLEQGFFGKKPRMLPYQSSQNTFSYEKDSKGKILLVKDRSAFYKAGELSQRLTIDVNSSLNCKRHSHIYRYTAVSIQKSQQKNNTALAFPMRDFTLSCLNEKVGRVAY